MRTADLPRVFLVSLTSSLLCSACTTAVNVTLTNASKLEQSATLQVKHRGIVEQEHSLGTLTPDGSLRYSLSVKHGREIQVSTAASGYTAWTSSPVTITASPDPRTEKFDARPTARILDEASGVKLIADEFTKIGHNYGLSPYKARPAAERYLGSLVLLIPPGDNESEGQELLRVSPTQFLGTTAPQPLDYQNTISEHKVEISGSNALQLSANIGFFKTGGSYKNESLYQLEWSLKGYGFVLVQEPKDWNIVSALSNLPEETKAALRRLMETNSKAVLLYVSRMYAVRDGMVSSTEGKKLASGAQLDAASIVGFGGAWTFTSAASNKTQFSEAVLNLEGEVIHLSLLTTRLTRPSRSSTGGDLEFSALGKSFAAQLSAADVQNLRRSLAAPTTEEATVTVPVNVRVTPLRVTFAPRTLHE